MKIQKWHFRAALYMRFGVYWLYYVENNVFSLLIVSQEKGIRDT